MSVTNEKALFQIARRESGDSILLKPLLEELIHRAQVFHLTITAPSREQQTPEQSKQIQTSMQAWKRRVAVEDALAALNSKGIEIQPVNFEDFCQAISELYPDRPASLPPAPSVRPIAPEKQPSFYEKMLARLGI